MNQPTSQCSSECESGWTLYLDQSSHSKIKCYSFGGNVDEECAEKGASVANEGEEEDLSMVSDASSGPRHYCEDEDCFDDNGYFFSPPSSSEMSKTSNKKKKIKEHGRNQQDSYLDDTASSTVLGFSKKNITLPKRRASIQHEDFSARHLTGKATFKKHFDFFKSPLAEKPAYGETGSLQ